MSNAMADAKYVFRPRRGGAIAIKLHGHVVTHAPSMDAARAWVAARVAMVPPAPASGPSASAIVGGPAPGLNVGADGRRGWWETGTGRWTWLL
jgi:hypothetical protein